VKGKVTCPNDRIFPDIVVQVLDEGGALVDSQAVGADGEYYFDLPLAGTYTATLGNLPDGITDVSYSVDGGPYTPGNSVTGYLGEGTTTVLDWLVDGPACNPCGPGTATPGYWKNHPGAWPVEEIVIGAVTYTKAEAIAIMSTPVAKDKRYTMFPALVSAKLNLLVGTESSCITDTIEQADQWMATFGGSAVKASSEAWKIGEPLYCKLDAYNNGLLCAPHRD